jgi:formylglycine-generating enzyme required for sulfatase activity
MVLIPEGRFHMGGGWSGDAYPVRSVFIKAFAMGKYEITRDASRPISRQQR